MSAGLITLAYLVAASLFIFGLKGLSRPRTAVRANLLGATGMLIAIVVTLIATKIVQPWVIIAGIAVGSGIGAVLALKIQMTAMPQMVALLNGFGGIASVLVAGAALSEALHGGAAILDTQFRVATALSGIIGGVTFFGSLIAFAKLQELMKGQPILFAGRHVVNALLLLASAGIAVWLCLQPEKVYLYWLLVGLASILGVTSVIPIGGADMPVVISLLNAYSGLAACATGFVINNSMLIIAGALVGSSGIILSQIMCVAMNRSLANVLFGGVGAVSGDRKAADAIYEGKIKSATADDVALVLEAAQRVVIVPGYGMAVAQAQHAVRDVYRLLESRGVEVEFGIHPVAGRMPGHMNVLLAEADIPYEKLKDMDQINATFDQTDVVIVNGANDVVNPVARTDPSSPIAGMPILDVDKAKTVVVIKRSLSPGFAGIPNPLFAADNTLMFFGDGKKTLVDLIAAMKEG